MEPRVIDFYNELPSGVIVIDKMNEEFSELQSINEDLINTLKLYENPQILFRSREEYDEIHEKMFSAIKKTIDEYFDDFEYTFMKDYGITPKQRVHISITIQDELMKITNDKHFSYIESYEAINSVGILTRGRNLPHWNKIYDALSKDELKDIFYDQIKHHIKEYTSLRYKRFRCSECKKLDYYINEEHKCFACYTESD